MKQYSCSNCNSAVRKVHNTFKVQVPVLDHNGRPLFNRVREPKTGNFVWKQQMTEKNMRGLGHWHCERRCLGSDMKTKVRVN